MDMHNRITAGIAEATRLTRAGRLLEATALIQNTLHGLSPQEASSSATACTDDEALDVSFRVVDEAPSATEGVSAGGASLLSSFPMTTPPPPQTAMPPSRGSASDLPTSREERHSGISTPIHDHDQSEQRESVMHHSWTARPMLPAHGSALGRPISRPLPDRARGDIRAGGQFTDGFYTSQAGTRAYKLYVPSGYTGQPLPLVVMLHGCTQTPNDFAAGTRMNVFAVRELFVVLYPQHVYSANHLTCSNWLQATHQQRGQGEPSIIAGLTQEILRSYHLDTGRVYVVGLSAGGAMATILGITYPELYAAIGIHSGLAYGIAHDLASAHAAMQRGGSTRTRRAAGTRRGAQLPRAIVFHGDQDMTVHPRNADQIVAQWTALYSEARKPAESARLRVSVSLGQVADGHAYTRSNYCDPSGRVM